MYVIVNMPHLCLKYCLYLIHVRIFYVLHNYTVVYILRIYILIFVYICVYTITPSKNLLKQFFFSRENDIFSSMSRNLLCFIYFYVVVGILAFCINTVYSYVIIFSTLLCINMYNVHSVPTLNTTYCIHIYIVV